MLSLGDALAVMLRRRFALAVRRIAGRDRLLDLEHQRVLFPIAEAEHHVIACADATGPHDLERDVHWLVCVEDDLAIRALISTRRTASSSR